MKLVFDRKGIRKDYPYSNVIAIPTTAKEKKFFSECKRDNGSDYKLWVYKKLYELDNLVIDNPMADGYDEDGNLIFNSEPIFDMVLDMTRNGDDYVGIPKPSNFCILSLYYTLSKRYNKVRRLNSLYTKRILMWLNQSYLVSKEEGDNNYDTKQY